jgi:hypothetical protein
MGRCENIEMRKWGMANCGCADVKTGNAERAN